MPSDSSHAGGRNGTAEIVLGIDTCGPSGSVALSRIDGDLVQVLGQKELAGRSYSASLVAAAAELLESHEVMLPDARAIVVVHGPGSFTGVRVGLSAVKGLAEAALIPVVAVSRLEALAWKAKTLSAALDAHRHEVFLRLSDSGVAREFLAGREELRAVEVKPERIAVCDDASVLLLAGAWDGIDFARVEAPSAADAIEFAMERIRGGQFADLASLDGHYLRRSDAEIFGEKANSATKAKAATLSLAIRDMRAEDIEQMMEIAAAERDAPHWAGSAYEAALKPDSQRRIARVAEDVETGAIAGFAILRVTQDDAELESIVTAARFQRKGVARTLFGSLAHQLRLERVGRVFLEVRKSNLRGAALYQSLGFVESGRRRRYYVDPVEDAVLMHCSLDGRLG
jgi:tRNA threonylcarbamoyladenosine biosynthesis protein TsaB